MATRMRLQDGDVHGTDPWRQRLLATATWMEAFAASGYGPDGAHKIVALADGGTVVCTSPASALREAGVVSAAARPFAAVARQVQSHCGDQATTALLLTARLVRHALDAVQDGHPVQAYLEGYGLAHRQVRATLAAHSRDMSPEAALATVGPVDRVASLLEGLAAFPVARNENAATNGPAPPRLDLDAIDVRAEPVPDAVWAPGVVVEPQGVPVGCARAAGGVLLTRDGPPRPRNAPGATLRSAVALAAWQQETQDRDAEVAARLVALGVRFWACRGAVPEALQAALVQRGILVAADTGKDVMARLAAATGATPTHDPYHATAADVGQADLERLPRRRGGGWSVQGTGPAATWILPAANATARAAAIDAGERLLRAAGVVLLDPRGVPGGGRWQRQAAASIRAAAALAPGKAPLGMAAAADAVAALADDLIRNAGGDPLDASGAARDDDVEGGHVVDPYACVRIAVDAAFEAARGMLRIDARYDRRASDAATLRGGTGPAGSPKGLPGDIPPLM